MVGVNDSIRSIAVIMACHNRADFTRRCLEALRTADTNSGCLSIHLFITDDGSSDGTSDVIVELFPKATLVRGDGTWYWARSMAAAEAAALTDINPDFLLWLNDDTFLEDDALERLVAVCDTTSGIAVGSTYDLQDDRVVPSYGGLRRTGRHPQRLRLVAPGSDPIAVDTFNGNCVLVPASIIGEIGGIDSSYRQECADLDFGYRANERGYPITVAPGYIGKCIVGERPQLSGGPLRRWRQMNGPKGTYPLDSQVRFLRRHAKAIWLPLLTWGLARRVLFGAHK